MNKTYTIKPTTSFIKDVKLAKRRGLDMSKLNEVVGALALGQRLPASRRDHALKGDQSGRRECHIAPNWLLVYSRDDDLLTLFLIRTGTHAELGLGS